MAKIHKNTKTQKHLPHRQAGKNKKIAPQPEVGINEQVFQETLKKRQGLMWLGVIASTAIILLLWLLSFKFNFLPSPGKELPKDDNLGNLIQELQKTFSETKDSFANIGKLINEQQPSGSQPTEQEMTKELKEKVLNKLGEEKESFSTEKNNQPASGWPSEPAGEPEIIIFK